MNGSVHRRRDQWQNWDPRSAQGQPLGLKGRKPCHLWQRGWAWRHQANEISQSQKDKCRYCTTPFLRKIENSWAHWPQRRWGGRNGEVLVKGTELWSLGWAHPGDVLCDAGHDRQSCVVCFNIGWESSSHVKCSYCKKTLRTKIERNWVKTLELTDGFTVLIVTMNVYFLQSNASSSLSASRTDEPGCQTLRLGHHITFCHYPRVRKENRIQFRDTPRPGGHLAASSLLVPPGGDSFPCSHSQRCSSKLTAQQSHTDLHRPCPAP